MTLKELKTKIENHSLDDSMLIFKYSDNTWLVNSYVAEIAKIRNKEILYINTLPSLNNVVATDDYLYVLRADEFNLEDNYRNLIVITKKSTNKNAIVFPKLEEWHIKSYIKSNLLGLTGEDSDYLFNLTKNNIYLTEREINKIKLELKPNQGVLFELLKKEHNYDYLLPYTPFELVNLIVKKDINKLSEYLVNVKEVEPLGLVSLLLAQYKNIIKVKMGSKDTTPEKLGFDLKKWNAIQYTAKKYKDKELLDNFEFLTSIDYRIKEGNLDLNKQDLFYYIISNLLKENTI